MPEEEKVSSCNAVICCCARLLLQCNSKKILEKAGKNKTEYTRTEVWEAKVQDKDEHYSY